MFTGIVAEEGRVVEARAGLLRIRAAKVSENARLGDSIAINGVDLTVAERSEDSLTFHAMPETYLRSNLGQLCESDPVNLENSVRPTDRLSGHIVRGVVEGTATLLSRERDEDAVVLTYRALRELLEYVLVKGPVCIDGASLTVIARTADTFSVSLVQYTQAHTTHASRPLGSAANLETDLLARYVGAILEARGVVPRARLDRRTGA